MEKYMKSRGKPETSVQWNVLPVDLLQDAGCLTCSSSGTRGQGSRSHGQCEGSRDSSGQCAWRAAASKSCICALVTGDTISQSPCGSSADSPCVLAQDRIQAGRSCPSLPSAEPVCSCSAAESLPEWRQSPEPYCSGCPRDSAGGLVAWLTAQPLIALKPGK